MGRSDMASNRLRAERYRSQIQSFFLLNLIRVVPRIPFDKISTHLRDSTKPTSSHLLLGDKFGVTVSSTAQLRLSEAVNTAKANAARDQREFGAAVVQRYRSPDASDQYVILDLDTFARLVRAVEGRAS